MHESSNGTDSPVYRPTFPGWGLNLPQLQDQKGRNERKA